jgi:hypothetical protein
MFFRQVRKTIVPKGFKLPTDKIKYEGFQEPKSWLDDYLQRIRVHGGTKATTMQSLQLFLSGHTRSWLRKLLEGSIEHWDDLRDQFIRNFRSTFKRPTSIEELRKCVQKSGESMRLYLQRWSMIKNSAGNISAERAIDVFNNGLHRTDFVEEMGRARPRTLGELMDLANKCASSEDTTSNKQGR